MKFYRVKGEFPVGVVLCTSVWATTASSEFDVRQFVKDVFKPPTFSSLVERLTSAEPVRLTLEVPEKAAAATALMLRAMADELEGKL